MKPLLWFFRSMILNLIAWQLTGLAWWKQWCGIKTHKCFVYYLGIFFSDLDEKLAKGYKKPEHSFDIWHLIKVKSFSLFFIMLRFCPFRLWIKTYGRLQSWNLALVIFIFISVLVIISSSVLSAWMSSISNQMWWAFISSIGTV